MTKDKLIGTHVDQETYDEFYAACKVDGGRTASNAIRMLVQEYIDRINK